MDLLKTLPAWVAISRQDPPLDLGLDVETAVGRARELVEALRTAGPVTLELGQQDEASDVLHAACLLLSTKCETAPRDTLEIATELEALLSSCNWRNDELDEIGDLLRTLEFICLRSARIAGLSAEAQRWETRYRDRFRDSLQFEAANEGTTISESISCSLTLVDSEAVFQNLLFLQDQAEADREAVSHRAADWYRIVESAEHLPADLRFLFLAEFARLKAGVMRGWNDPAEVAKWIERAETHARQGPDPEPLLARLALSRLVQVYAEGHCPRVLEMAPALDVRFTELAMKEDQIKCRILWAVSLKLLGRCEEGLRLLDPLKNDPEVRPALLGWILANCGDMHQMCGEYHIAVAELASAWRLLRENAQLTGLGDVTAVLSSIYRAHGRFAEALELLDQARQQYSRFGYVFLDANCRLVAAEIYLAMGNPRQAEIEVRAALPILQQHNVVADAVVAVNLLREARSRQTADAKPSVRSRKK